METKRICIMLQCGSELELRRAPVDEATAYEWAKSAQVAYERGRNDENGLIARTILDKTYRA